MFKPNQLVKVANTDTKYDGKVWMIYGKAPSKAFRLPNGRMHESPRADDAWIVEMDAPMNVSVDLGNGIVTKQFTNNYGVCDAKYLEAFND